MRILITAFEPFNGRDINPTEKLLKDIKVPKGVECKKLLLPVEFTRTSEILSEVLPAFNPGAVLSLGQAGNSPSLSVERVALNLDNCKGSMGKSVLKDNAGYGPVDEPINANGPIAYYSTLPVWEMVKASNEVGTECRVSYSAGTYVCNHVMYTCLNIIDEKKLKAVSGFVHVPFLPEQFIGTAPSDGQYIMDYKVMLTGVQAMVNYLSQVK